MERTCSPLYPIRPPGAHQVDFAVGTCSLHPQAGCRCPVASRKRGRPAPCCSPARLRTGVRLQETALSQLGAPISSTHQDRPADSTSPPGGPQRPSQQTRPRSEPQTPLYGRRVQDGHSRKGPQRPWGPWQGQQWRASGIPEPEK